VLGAWRVPGSENDDMGKDSHGNGQRRCPKRPVKGHRLSAFATEGAVPGRPVGPLVPSENLSKSSKGPDGPVRTQPARPRAASLNR
jgi:hypothetical protein